MDCDMSCLLMALSQVAWKFDTSEGLALGKQSGGGAGATATELAAGEPAVHAGKRKATVGRTGGGTRASKKGRLSQGEESEGGGEGDASPSVPPVPMQPPKPGSMWLVPQGGRKAAHPAVIEAVSENLVTLLYLKACKRGGRKRWARHPAPSLPEDWLEELNFEEWGELGAVPSALVPLIEEAGPEIEGTPRNRLRCRLQ